MADYPSIPQSCTPLFIQSNGMFAGGGGTPTGNFTHSSTAWPAANRAIYIPLSIPFPYFVGRVFWMNAAAIGNMDFGIYHPDGTRIYSTGSTAQSGTTVIQYVTPSTQFILAPGSYFLAINNDGTTNRGLSQTGDLESQRLTGFFQQDVGAVTLPASATFSAYTTAFMPLCGITRTTTGF